MSDQQKPAPRRTYSIRFSAREEELFRIASGCAGMKLSEWIRDACRRIAEQDEAKRRREGRR